MSKDATFYTSSETETENFAAQISKETSWGNILAINGDLGTGKTVFARGFIKSLKEENIIVTSPSFTLIKEYHIMANKWVYHLDLYRISNSLEASEFGVEELLTDPNSIKIIEWPNKISEILPEKTIYLNIQLKSPTKRKISIFHN